MMNSIVASMGMGSSSLLRTRSACGLLPPKKNKTILASFSCLSSRRTTVLGSTLSISPSGSCFFPLNRRPPITFASRAHDDSHRELEVHKEKDSKELGAEKLEEAWKETLESFKEQAMKMQKLSRQASRGYHEKAIAILKETDEQLIQLADKARQELSFVTKDITNQGMEYLLVSEEHAPEPVKEIAEVYSTSRDYLNYMSKIPDFYFGIPYGLLLSVDGFALFMLNGCLSTLRFGTILGAALLALSISSLRSYKKGKPNALALKGQAAIATIIFLRELLCVLFQRSIMPQLFTTFISGTMVALYAQRIKQDGMSRKDSRSEPKTKK